MMPAPPTWLLRFADWLTPRRIRVQAIILAVCLWSVAIADFSNAGLMDRAGNIKFQDFLAFYTGGKLVLQDRSGDLFDFHAQQNEYQTLLGKPTEAQLPGVYGPQVSLLFSTFSRLPFLVAALTWAMVATFIYLLCCFWIWRSCPQLDLAPGLIIPILLAFPPFFHFVVRGQLSSLVLLCFTAAFYAFRSGYTWVAGLALGSLIFKPQFLIGILVILFFGFAWKSMAGVFVACLLQLGLAWSYFGTAVMRAYLATLWHLPQMATSLEPGISQAQMHSLRSFWVLLVPWRTASEIAYILSSVVVLVIATKVWKSRGALTARFSALVLATVLVNPHLFVYDLVVLVPVFFVIANWALENPANEWSQGVRPLLYLSFILPLFGPLTIWTHVQLSVIAFAGLLMVVRVISQAQVLQNDSQEVKS
jgi:Glycosyltransferase family 87